MNIDKDDPKFHPTSPRPPPPKSQTAPSRDRWEYLSVAEIDATELTADRLGREGWELVTSMPRGLSLSYWELWFKRRLP